jgi:hypothetical protein
MVTVVAHRESAPFINAPTERLALSNKSTVPILMVLSVDSRKRVVEAAAGAVPLFSVVSDILNPTPLKSRPAQRLS